MKKKTLLIIVCVVLAAVIAAALLTTKDRAPEGTVEVPEIGQPVVITVTPQEETTTKKSGKKSLEDKIEVVLPADVVESKYNGNLEAFAKAKGYDSVVPEGEDKVRIVMKEFSYDLLLTQKGMITVTGISETIESKKFPYVKDILSYNEDFSQIVLSVKSKSFKKADNSEALFELAAGYALYYQLYLKDSSMECEILIVEEGTNILLATKTLTPDNFAG